MKSGSRQRAIRGSVEERYLLKLQPELAKRVRRSAKQGAVSLAAWWRAAAIMKLDTMPEIFGLLKQALYRLNDLDAHKGNDLRNRRWMSEGTIEKDIAILIAKVDGDGIK